MPGGRLPYEESKSEVRTVIDLPGLEKLATSLQTDESLYERIRQENKDADRFENITFPPDPILSKGRYGGRGLLWPQRTLIVEPSYVCYDRLYFEDRNSERYGWDFGIVHPILSAGEFLADLALVPYHFGTCPFIHDRDCNSGYCLPGDPVPFLLYAPDLSVRGAIAEAAVIFALIAIFP
jgi:hypothetical protein